MGLELLQLTKNKEVIIIIKKFFMSRVYRGLIFLIKITQIIISYYYFCQQKMISDYGVSLESLKDIIKQKKVAEILFL